jgi:hypothetical protein
MLGLCQQTRPECPCCIYAQPWCQPSPSLERWRVRVGRDAWQGWWTLRASGDPRDRLIPLPSATSVLDHRISFHQDATVLLSTLAIHGPVMSKKWLNAALSRADEVLSRRAMARLLSTFLCAVVIVIRPFSRLGGRSSSIYMFTD